ncbi:MAG TPA: Arc family DNA-binding protein [Candidatus Acidoferrales bacterium]|nr:Arc family DNA-binding protein [Candidatus Acidoferrales bacterium]
MAQFVVRNIEDEVKARLQRRAKRHGRNMEQEVREILRDAVKAEGALTGGGLGAEFASLFAQIGLDSDIAELRGSPLRPASLLR